ncbi:hypothetical protein B0H17DRAFT_1219128 [Mycena rosella]|uniref:Uncharacterized protein n=1 Tax=Mycena rosella TaxID=1033263 RepID=A0AAD7FJQ2_MYCRO|nr:hypothetical protein B0H17DRAFT_1219128 [Mycena rosella]
MNPPVRPPRPRCSAAPPPRAPQHARRSSTPFSLASVAFDTPRTSSGMFMSGHPRYCRAAPRAAAPERPVDGKDAAVDVEPTRRRRNRLRRPERNTPLGTVLVVRVSAKHSAHRRVSPMSPTALDAISFPLLSIASDCESFQERLRAYIRRAPTTGRLFALDQQPPAPNWSLTLAACILTLCQQCPAAYSFCQTTSSTNRRRHRNKRGFLYEFVILGQQQQRRREVRPIKQSAEAPSGMGAPMQGAGSALAILLEVPFAAKFDLRNKFSAIHYECSPSPRKFYAFCMSITDTATTGGIIATDVTGFIDENGPEVVDSGGEFTALRRAACDARRDARDSTERCACAARGRAERVPAREHQGHIQRGDGPHHGRLNFRNFGPTYVQFDTRVFKLHLGGP